MIKVITLIPLRYNDGTKVEKDSIDWFEKEILKITGGITNEGIVKGSWVFQNEKYNDISYKYIIGVEPGEMDAVKKVILQMKEHLKQEAMYFEVDENTKITYL